jgi:Cu(I)/Ag(I) efflux system protein CusF
MKTLATLAVTAAFAAVSPLALADVGCKATPESHHDHSGCGAHATEAQSAVYKATGSVKSVNKPAGKVTIAHEAIADLHWPAMTMQFGVADKKLLDELAAGKKVDFRFVQRGTDYIVTALY